MNYRRVAILSSIIIAIGFLVFFDYQKVLSDFRNLKSLLNETRHAAITTGRSLIVRFNDKEAQLLSFSGTPIRKMEISTLHKVNYDTTRGKGVIVFTPTGTHPYNLRVHGGDIRLKSWFGFEKNIAVNCYGLVSEGVYPE